jgi:hypothetical protein
MNLEHPERQRWCRELAKINQKLNGEEAKSFFDM